MIDTLAPVHLFNSFTLILCLGISLVTLALVLRRENRERRLTEDQQVEEYGEYLSDVFPSGPIGQPGPDMSDTTVRFPRSRTIFTCRDTGGGENSGLESLGREEPV